MNTASTAQARTLEPSPSLPVAAELSRVERRLAQLLDSRESRLTEISRYLVDSGGKRVRPAVVLLTYRACGGGDARIDDVVDVAVALELIHSASLLHDDIIDGATIRRGRDSALQRFGLAQTLVAGDYLFGLAYQLCARFEERLIRWAVDACILLTEGEIMQGRFRHNPEVRLEDYFEIVRRKTASLFAAGARTAAYLAGASESTIEAAAGAGNDVGITFQIIDDLLDVTGDPEQTGKVIGLDLRDGNPSLPIVLALRDDPEVRPLFARPELTDPQIAATLDRLARSPVIEEARELARDHARRARASLKRFDPGDDRTYLLGLVDQLVERVA